MRARALERIVALDKFEFQCKHDPCKHKGPASLLTGHESSCPHRIVPCPILSCKELMKAKDVLSHVKSKKKKHINTKLTAKFTSGTVLADWQFSDNAAEATWVTGVYCADEKLFRKTFFVCMKKCRDTGLYHTWIKVNDHKHFADRCHVKIIIKGGSEDEDEANTVKTVFKTKAISIDEKEDELTKNIPGFNENHIKAMLSAKKERDQQGQEIARVLKAAYIIEWVG